MARDFDGTDDYADLGSDASIDDFSAITFSAWMQFDALGANLRLFSKSDTAETLGLQILIYTALNRLMLARAYSGGLEYKYGGTTISTGTRYHLAVTHNGDVATNPVLYVNGTAESISTLAEGSGTLVADASADAWLGAFQSSVAWTNGNMGNVVYHNAQLDAAAVNRARWWGRPQGGLAVYHPFWTDKTVNEGTATATASMVGPTVAAFAIPVQRPGSAMLGMGVGF